MYNIIILICKRERDIYKFETSNKAALILKGRKDS